ncbi:MAG TPA: translocation/assembly module TamB domain-containing protein [Polyangiaceae bacterium]|nr:translocation/assembly module TamB domain-containing protein [Polyangiaceae bacterium]
MGLIVALLACINLPPLRVFAASKVSQALEGAFRGKLVIDRISRFDWSGVRGVDAHASDPAGKRVITVRGLSVHLPWPRLVWDLLVTSPVPQVIVIDDVSFDHAEVVVRDDGSGEPTLAQTFASPSVSTKPGTPTNVFLRRLRFTHVWVHGALGSTPPIDADLSALDGSLTMDQAATAFAVEALSFKARGLPGRVDPEGQLRARGRLPLALDRRKIDAWYHGKVAGTALTLEAHLAGQSLKTQAQAEGAGGNVDLHAELFLGEPMTASINLAGRALDVSALVAGGPASQVTFDLSAHGRKRGERFEASYELALEPSLLAGQSLPGMTTRGRVQRDPAGPTRVDGSAQVRERGAATSVEYALSFGKASLLEAQTETVLDNPPRLFALAGVRASGTVSGRLHADLEQELVDARLEATLPSVRQGQSTIEHLKLLATANGPLSNPGLVTELRAARLTLPGWRFSRARVLARGSLREQQVEAELNGQRGERIQAASLVLLEPELGLRNTTLRVQREHTTLDARAERVRFAPRFELRRLQIEGVGQAEVSLTMGKHLERLQARTSELDLARLAWLFGVQAPLQHGKASFDVELVRRRGKPDGFVRGKAAELALGVINNGRVEVDLRFERGKASGCVQANLERGGEAFVTLEDVALLEPPYDRGTLSQLTGKMTAHGSVDLDYLDSLFALEQVPFERGSGKIDLDLDLSRELAGEQLPDLNARVVTRNFQLVGKRTNTGTLQTDLQARAAQPFVIKDIDLDGSLELEGQSGVTSTRLRAFDKRGDLLTLDAKTKLAPKLSEALHPELGKLALEARLHMPERRLAELPSIVPIPATRGSAELEMELDGTPRDPRVRLSGRLRGFRALEARTQGLDVDFHGSLAHAGGELSVAASSAGRRVAALETRFEGDLEKLGGPKLEQSPVTGQALLELDRFPISSLPGAQARDFSGELSGRLALADFGQDAKLVGHLEARPLKLGQARFEHVLVSARAQEGRLQLDAEIKEADGSARGTLRANADWGARLLPKLQVPLEAGMSADNFSIAGLSPLLPGSINELGGRLNARLAGTFGGAKPELKGEAELEHGVLQEPTIGQRFHDISARVRLTKGEVRLEHLSARGSAGKLTATATAHLDGLRLRDADAHLRIEKRDKIPLTTQGVAVGDAWGKVDAAIKPGDEQTGMRVTVKVTEFHIELPEADPHGVQELDPANDVRVGVHEHEKFATLALQPLEKAAAAEPGPPTVISVELGKVTVRKGTELDVELTGKTLIAATDPVTISGQIRLRGGTLDVSGKLFHIERGIITFQGQDPGNPLVVATARWDSPADYVVYAEYTGTANDGKLTLSSEPPLTQDQVLSLLMFGNPDGTMGSSSGDPAAAAFGVVGGTAARGLNRVLSKMTNLDIDARVDTSTGSARPELVMQLTPRLSAHLTRALGEPAPGQAPDRTFGMLDLRLTGRWSLQTMVGDRGASALDLIWRYRY